MHLAGIEQPVPFPAADIQRGDPARLRAELLHEGDDRKGIALAALDFDPAFYAPGAIGRVLLFADDPLEAHGAGTLMDLGAVSLEVLKHGTKSAVTGRRSYVSLPDSLGSSSSSGREALTRAGDVVSHSRRWVIGFRSGALKT